MSHSKTIMCTDIDGWMYIIKRLPEAYSNGDNVQMMTTLKKVLMIVAFIYFGIAMYGAVRNAMDACPQSALEDPVAVE